MPFFHLSAVKTLCINRYFSLTDAAFQHLSSLTYLDMTKCNQTSITDNSFDALPKPQLLSYLNISYCRQKQITGRSLKRFFNLTKIVFCGCNDQTVDAIHHLEIGVKKVRWASDNFWYI